MRETISLIGGTGAMGSGLAYRWALAGYPVIIGSRNEHGAEKAAAALRERVPGADIRGAVNKSAAENSAIVVLTVRYAHRDSTLEQIAGGLSGKLLVDTTVPLRPPKVGRVQLPSAGCAAKEILDFLDDDVDVDVVSAFQNVSAHLLDSDARIDCDVLVTGNKVAARQRVITLANDAGMQAWHAGPLDNAAAAEALTSVLIHINKRYGFEGSGLRITPGKAPAAAGTAGKSAPDRLEIIALKNLPEIGAGDDLADVIEQGLSANNLALADGDVLVIAQKAISKAEHRLVKLDSVVPAAAAQELAKETQKDPRLVELILQEANEVIRKKPGVIVVEHRLGMVMANAGIDQSNVPEGHALLLPRDPDKSADTIRSHFAGSASKRIAVVISDSVGRAWRNGTVGQAIGVAGLDALIDLRGQLDRFGRPLRVTEVAVADALAAAATLTMGEADESRPVVLLRGYEKMSGSIGMQSLLRDRSADMFR